jgi:hypothetical protein
MNLFNQKRKISLKSVKQDEYTEDEVDVVDEVYEEIKRSVKSKICENTLPHLQPQLEAQHDQSSSKTTKETLVNASTLPSPVVGLPRWPISLSSFSVKPLLPPLLGSAGFPNFPAMPPLPGIIPMPPMPKLPSPPPMMAMVNVLAQAVRAEQEIQHVQAQIHAGVVDTGQNQPASTVEASESLSQLSASVCNNSTSSAAANLMQRSSTQLPSMQLLLSWLQSPLTLQSLAHYAPQHGAVSITGQKGQSLLPPRSTTPTTSSASTSRSGREAHSNGISMALPQPLQQLQIQPPNGDPSLDPDHVLVIAANVQRKRALIEQSLHDSVASLVDKLRVLYPAIQVRVDGLLPPMTAEAQTADAESGVESEAVQISDDIYRTASCRSLTSPDRPAKEAQTHSSFVAKLARQSNQTPAALADDNADGGSSAGSGDADQSIVTARQIATLPQWHALLQQLPISLLNAYERRVFACLCTSQALLDQVLFNLLDSVHRKQRCDANAFKALFGAEYCRLLHRNGRLLMIQMLFWSTLVIYVFREDVVQKLFLTRKMFMDKYCGAASAAAEPRGDDSLSAMFQPPARHFSSLRVQAIESLRLLTYRNVMIAAFHLIPPGGNEALLLRVASCVELAGKTQGGLNWQVLSPTKQRWIYRLESLHKTHAMPPASSSSQIAGSKGEGDDGAENTES